ncbi:hypothetical protein AVEN_97064-1 [Araneus ventricosus]|uniref:Uncharacterized protein n=1 Tax=Araneus ventricosus TaxID=182803 RepID=A0A4Y2WZ21_ARAVE|nr:hypothetical protein AVEN_97064-1 [Araneus ventricosus]
MTAGTVRILGKPSFSPNPSGRAILTKKECAAGEKSITLNEGVEISETAIVFCLKRRLGRSRIDRVGHPTFDHNSMHSLGSRVLENSCGGINKTIDQ